jgi:adenine-specific DNA-methyltransferase
MHRPAPGPPKLQTTTLWYHPSQQHDSEQVHGDPRYAGRTPSYVVWNLLQRYTRPGDRVLDPFAGGGTTLDVAAELGRESVGFDLVPRRDDIRRADARALPLEDESVDFVFMDPPYSTHLDYSDDPRCIGKLDAFAEDYFDAMEAVFGEVARVLGDRRYLAVYVSDSFKKGRGFAGIGARLFGQLERRFRAVDHVAVVRGNRKLEKPAFHRAAAEGNFFLRGFQHLLIFKKERPEGKGVSRASTAGEAESKKRPRRRREA